MAKRRLRTSKRTQVDAPAVELSVPLPSDGPGSVEFWRGEIEQAQKRIEEEIPAWQKNLDRYKGMAMALPRLSSKDTVQVNVDFYNTEQKKAQLFYQTPDLQITPRHSDFAAAAPIVQAVMNDMLGPDEIDAKAMIDEVLSDVLVPAGIGVTKIGYERVQVPVDVPQIGPDGQPAIDPITGIPAPPQTVQKTVWEETYWRRISPSDVLIPAGFLSTRYDHAPWLGWRFRADAEMMERTFSVDAGSLSEIKADKTLASERDRKYIQSCPTGVEIWYRAHLYDPSVKNPELIRRLVILEGGRDKSVVVHEDSPNQEFDENGAFKRGMRGLPIHILSLRAVSDTSYPPSDCQISRSAVDELSRSRSQMLRQRDRALPLRGFDKNRVRAETIKQIEDGTEQSLIPFDGNPSEMIVEVASANYPNENFSFNGHLQTDVDRLWALGSNQQGVQTDTTRSATEIKAIQDATDTRLAKERERVLAWYLKGCEKVLSLFQLFAEGERVARVVGQDGAARLETWNRDMIQGRYAFSAKPDSSVRLNAAEHAERQLRFNNLTANNQYFDQLENAKSLARAFNQDPEKLVKPPQPPPPPPPEKPKISLSIKGEDLNPMAPQYLNVVYLLQVSGVEGMQPQQTPAAPPATAEAAHTVRSPRPVPPVDKHDSQLNGKMPGPGPV